MIKDQGSYRSVYFQKRSDWRAWFEKHHLSEKEFWLVFYKKHTGKRCITYDEALDEALCFGWIDSIIKRLDNDTYMRKFTRRRNTIKWSETNKEKVRTLIIEGRMTAAGLSKISIEELQKPPRFKDEKKLCNPDLPKFIKEKFMKTPIAWEKFQKLSPSHRRNYILWITQAKKEATQLRRISESIRLLTEGKSLGLK